MPPLPYFLPSLPWPFLDIVVNVIAGLGTILVTYAIFLESERRQDAVFVVGAGCLLVYALWIGNLVFSLAMAGLMIGAFIEMVEIYTHHHKHNKTMVEEYKNEDK